MNADKQTLLTLADRIEAATAGDRELDVAIGLTGRFYIAEPRYPGAEPMIGYVDEDGSRVEPGIGEQDRLVPRYTESLDAAMALVPEDAREWHCGKHYKTGQGQAYMLLATVLRDPIYCLAATPALALTAAALRALAHSTPPVVKAMGSQSDGGKA